MLKKVRQYKRLRQALQREQEAGFKIALSLMRSFILERVYVEVTDPIQPEDFTVEKAWGTMLRKLTEFEQAI